MSKIIAEFDTVEKTCVVNMDGKPVEHLQGLSFYKSYDKKKGYMMSMSTGMQDEENDMMMMNYVQASENGELKPIKSEVDKIQEEISKHLSQ